MLAEIYMILANQRNSNKLLSIFLILSVFSTNIAFFSAPVLAYEKADLFSKQIKSDSLNKSPNDNSLAENFLIEKNMNKKSDASKEYEKINNLKGLKQDKKVKQSYIAGEILVKYKNNKINLQTFKGRILALNFIRSKSLEKKEDLSKINTSVLRIKDGKTVEQKIAELKNDPNVEYVEPNYKKHYETIDTNDVYKNNLWGLDNTGQTVNNVAGASDADIDAPEAWAISEESEGDVIAAVIDSGVAYNHPDLLNNMWDGSNCKGENGDILGDCNHGYDYEDVDKTPLPTSSSHGTHIAGAIAAVKNNGKGIIGVAPNAKIMAIKFGLDIASEIKAINFAIQNGAKIINASFGGPDFSQFEYDAINAFRNAGGIFIAAAGNGGSDNIGDDNDLFPHYPSDYDLDNIISVAATDQNDVKTSFSNYGAISVDVGAPGVNIYSTVADSISFSENFETSTLHEIGSQFTAGGDTSSYWGVEQIGTQKALFTNDRNLPYISNEYAYVESGGINLAQKSEAVLDFNVWCDTESDPSDALYDFLGLKIYNGSAWSVLELYHESRMAKWLGSSAFSVNGYSGYLYSDSFNITPYLSSNNKIKFEWFTDTGNLDGAHLGCFIDEIKITSYSDGSDEQYDYYDGTSMAAPHVAGLAALVWGYKPELSYAEVKDTILTTGDNLTSLSGKTVTGKRINVFNALNSLAPETHTISGTIKYYDGVKIVPNATVILENDDGDQVDATATDVNGFYQFTDVAGGGDYVVRVEKDNYDSSVSGTDITKIRRHIVELEPFDSIFKIIAGDVNNSSSISGTDITKIRRYIVEIENLPSGSWKFYSSDAILTATNYLTVDPTIVYTNLTANMPNQNFIGIKMGDVNNSWNNN